MAQTKCDLCGQPLGEWAGSSPCCGSTVSDADDNMVLYGKVNNVNETEVEGFVADSLNKIDEVVLQKKAAEN